MTRTLKIAIPMAGYGSRMRPHTWSKPKPLIPLAGRTVLDHCLSQFSSLPAAFEPEYIFIVSPFQVEQVSAYLKQHYPGLPWQMVVQEVMRGQSDAVYLARQFLQDEMLVCFSDTLVDANFTGLDQEPLDGIAWVKPVPDPRRFGVAEVNASGRVTRFVEKPQSLENNRVVVGFYYFRSGQALMKAIEEQVRRNVSLKGEFFLTDAINILLESGAKMRTQEVSVWLDAGIPDAVLETNRSLLAHAFLDRFVQTQGRALRGFTADTIQAIESHPWPGNVREMENTIKRAGHGAGRGRRERAPEPAPGAGRSRTTRRRQGPRPLQYQCRPRGRDAGGQEAEPAGQAVPGLGLRQRGPVHRRKTS